MPTNDDIQTQRDRLQIYRGNLATYLRQLALHGSGYAPPIVTHGIRESRDAIARIKATLRSWGEAVEDHPDDEEAPAAPPQRSTAPGGGSLINFGSGNTFGDLNFGDIAGGGISNQTFHIGGQEPSATPIRSANAAQQPQTAPGERRQIFLCHASEDKPTVRALYRRLRADGLAPWLDEEDLLPGQEREPAIRKAVRSSAAVIVCLSPTAVSQAGFRHREIRLALDVADEQPAGAIFVIPARLEPCDLPDRLAHLHAVNLYEEGGYERLVQTLRMQK